MGQGATHQTKEDKIAAKALANRKAHTKKTEEHNLLSRHLDQTAILSEDGGEKNFLEKIKANRVQLLPLSIPILREVIGSDKQYEDIESGMKYLAN